MSKTFSSILGPQILSTMGLASSSGGKSSSILASVPSGIGNSQQLHDVLDKLKAIQFDISEMVSLTDSGEKETIDLLHVILGVAMTHSVALELIIVESERGKPVDMRLIKNASNFCVDVLTSFENGRKHDSAQQPS